jgi:hypothetical protein
MTGESEEYNWMDALLKLQDDSYDDENDKMPVEKNQK